MRNFTSILIQECFQFQLGKQVCIIRASKLGLLFRSWRYYTPSQLLILYKAQIRPCLEYGSHCGEGPPSILLPHWMQFRSEQPKLIGDPALTDSLDSLAHRRTISALSLYYIYFHGVCSVELKSIIPPKALFTRNTRFSNAQHPVAVKLDKNERAFSPTLLSLWPPETGTHSQRPSSPRLIIFSCLRPIFTNTINSSQPIKSSLLPLFTMEGANPGL